MDALFLWVAVGILLCVPCAHQPVGVPIIAYFILCLLSLLLVHVGMGPCLEVVGSETWQLPCGGYFVK